MNCTNTTEATNCHLDNSMDLLLFPITYITIFCLSLPLNSLALFAAFRQIQRKNELGVYLFNLSLADLLYTLTLPLWIDFTLHHDDWRAGPVLCAICSFLTFTNLYASTGFLCCISFVRFLGVVHPLRFLQVRTIRAAVIISLVVWALQSAIHTSLLIQIETTTDDHRHMLCYDIYPLEPWKAKLNYFRVAFGFAFPLALLLIFHYGIHHAIGGNVATGRLEKMRANKLMLSITVSFILCFAPYHTVLLVRSFREPGDCCFAQDIFKPYKLSMALTALNCLSDPVLYCFISETAREDVFLLTLLRQGKKKKHILATTQMTMD